MEGSEDEYRYYHQRWYGSEPWSLLPYLIDYISIIGLHRYCFIWRSWHSRLRIRTSQYSFGGAGTAFGGAGTAVEGLPFIWRVSHLFGESSIYLEDLSRSS
jgi:hypothetical protein